MLIQLTNLPSNTSVEEVNDLFCRMSIIDSIHVNRTRDPEHDVAWVDLRCSQAGANAISERLDGRMFKGYPVSAYAALFCH